MEEFKSGPMDTSEDAGKPGARYANIIAGSSSVPLQIKPEIIGKRPCFPVTASVRVVDWKKIKQ
jgi:hypothetical protein